MNPNAWISLGVVVGSFGFSLLCVVGAIRICRRVRAEQERDDPPDVHGPGGKP